MSQIRLLRDPPPIADFGFGFGTASINQCSISFRCSAIVFDLLSPYVKCQYTNVWGWPNSTLGTDPHPHPWRHELWICYFFLQRVYYVKYLYGHWIKRIEK